MVVQHRVKYGSMSADPEACGYETERLEQLDRHFLRLIDSGKLQGAAYLLARNGSVFAWRSMGRQSFRDGEQDSTLQPDAIRKIYSITKWFTAIAIMQLMERGKLLLQDSAGMYLEEFDTKLHSGITIFHLLTHTSGMMADPGTLQEPYPRPFYDGAADGKENWLRMVLAGPLHCKPGTQWIYSSAGFAALGEIITRVSGMAYEEYILTHIVEPLGMKDTSFVVPRDKLARLCVVAEWQEEAAYVPADRTGRPPLAGNGLYSTLHDLYLLGQMMLGGGSLNGMRILSRKSVEAMTRNQLGREVANNCWGGHSESYRFGLGLSLHDERPHSPGTYSHEGYGHCALFVDPKEKLVAAYLVPSIEGYHIESVVNTRQIIWSGIRSEAVIN